MKKTGLWFVVLVGGSLLAEAMPAHAQFFQPGERSERRFERDVPRRQMDRPGQFPPRTAVPGAPSFGERGRGNRDRERVQPRGEREMRLYVPERGERTNRPNHSPSRDRW